MSLPSVRNIDTELLRAFIAVVETGRMTAAARVVNRSQGAVSQQIKRLELLFDTVLFERRSDAAHLTRAGEKLVGLAQRLIALNDDVVGQMRGSDFAGEVRLGVPHDIVSSLLPPILRRFREAHPTVLVTLVSDASTLLRAQLQNREVDLVLSTDRERGLRRELLMTDRLVWVGARGGEAQRRRPLSVALGQDCCSFRACAVDALTRAGIEWRPICQVGSLEPVFATLQADMAVAPFLSRTVPDRVVALPPGELPTLPVFHINLRLPSSTVSAVAAELAEHIRDGFARRYA